MQRKLSAYYQLTKPGVLFGNVLTAAAGFFLAARGQVDWFLFFALIAGMTLVVGGACALNNLLDRDIDIDMERTRKRPSVTGVLSKIEMLVFSLSITSIGFILLATWTNLLTVEIGVVGFVTYIWLYGALSKRRSIHGTFVGSISGAMPIVGGYAAMSNTIDAGFIIAFFILFFWQFPEFYSIAIYRRKEYAAAGVPVMSVIKGNRTTIIQIFIYTILYVVSTLLLTHFGYTGWIYFIVMLLAGLYWISLAARGFRTPEPERWARKMFGFSMINILLLCVMLSIGPLLP